ncbi:MAG: amidohydrolase family protein [Acidobacteria bacterium]|nr:amidohydrolase family protein [Acidobacteriota bacterium]
MVRMRWLILFWMCVLSLGQAVKPQSIPPEVLAYPEMVLYNGKIVTMDDKAYNTSPGTIAQAIAIRGDRIMALGSDAEVLRLAGPSTLRMDLKGKAVIPGTINAHTHIHNHALNYWISQNPQAVEEVARSFNIEGRDFRELKRKLEVLLREHVQNSKPGQWALVGLPTGGSAGTGVGVRFLQEKQITLQELDKLTPANPVVLNSHPAGMINSAAKRALVELYGSEPGEEKIDDSGFGEVTDYMRSLILDSFFTDTARINKLTEIIKDGMEKQAALGTTTFSSHIMGLRFFDALMNLYREGQMPIRFGYTHYFGFQNNPDPASFYLRLGDMAGLGNDFFWQAAVGLGNVDSGPPMMCTTMEAPPEIKAREWCRNAPGTAFAKAIHTAITSRARVALGHAYGDKAVDYFMDQIEEAIRKDPGITLDYIRGRRFTSDHTGFYPRADQIPRLKKLGILISSRADYVNRSYPWLEIYGKQYASRVAPVKSLLDGGVKVVFESEIRVESGSGPTLFSYFVPFLNRKTRKGQDVAPEEAIDRVHLMKMATTWGSEYMLREKVIGSLEKGKLADLLVLNKDYFTVPIEEIADTYPLMTLVGGKVTVLREEFAKEIGQRAVGPQLKFTRGQSERE